MSPKRAGPTPRSLEYHLAEQALPDGVEAWLRERREAGHSYSDMAYELRSTYGVDVTDQGVRNWVHRLGIEAVGA